jgi:hypothetical protein
MGWGKKKKKGKPFLRWSHYVAQTGLELMIFMPQPPQCWDYTCIPPYLAKK